MDEGSQGGGEGARTEAKVAYPVAGQTARPGTCAVWLEWHWSAPRFHVFCPVCPPEFRPAIPALFPGPAARLVAPFRPRQTEAPRRPRAEGGRLSAASRKARWASDSRQIRSCGLWLGIDEEVGHYAFSPAADACSTDLLVRPTAEAAVSSGSQMAKLCWSCLRPRPHARPGQVVRGGLADCPAVRPSGSRNNVFGNGRAAWRTL